MNTIANREVQQRVGGASLDVLRFLAAFFIMLFHCFDDISSKTSVFEPLLKQGWLGTDLFLILSGVVMSRAYSNTISTGKITFHDFIIKRYFRLFPSHAVVLIVFGIIITAVSISGYKLHDGWGYNFTDWIKQFTLSHAWGLKIHVWNFPTWTISTLIICYMLFYLTIKYINKLPKIIVSLLAIMVIIAGNLIAQFVFNDRLVEIQTYPMLRAMTFFMLGVFADIITRNLKINKPQYVCCAGLISATIVLLVYANDEYLNILSVAKDNIIIALICILTVISSRVNFKETKETQELGKTSYSLYLVHAPTQLIGFEILRNLEGKAFYSEYVFWGVIAIMIIASVAIAIWFKSYIDKPLANATAKFLKNTQQIHMPKPI
ncbi:acyltransferase family protein [Pseudaquidulcibacter saccharophilus]|uniref:acyltransferase family protein n=1 Tax=Pseudaquidulcibacter saccharophilus TaxID=2831900 RepID=UPI001EFEF887|nr:acyltransferase [Pseudaquidulcibacter saccharophilus]